MTIRFTEFILLHLTNYPHFHLPGRKKPEETQAVYVPEVFPAKEKKQSLTQKTKSIWTSWQKRERNMGKQTDELVEGSREGTVGKSCNIDNVT